MNYENRGLSTVRIITTTTATSIELHNICVTDSQCMNGGICVHREIQQQQQQEGNNSVATSNNYAICQCTDKYTGVRCEQLKMCPLDCQNGGICHHNTNKLIFEEEEEEVDNTSTSSNSVIDYSCKCFGYYTGPLCTIPYTNCFNNIQCYNGGTCQSSTTTITKNNNNNKVELCVCPNGYTGIDCSIVSTIPNNKSNKNRNTFLSLFTSGNATNNVNKEETILLVLIVIVLCSLLIVLLYTCRHCYRKRMIEYQLINSSSSSSTTTSTRFNTTNDEGTACTEPYNIRDSVWHTKHSRNQHHQQQQSQQPVKSKSSFAVVLTDKLSTLNDNNNDNFELSQQYSNLKTKVEEQQQQQSTRWKNIV